MKIRRIVSLTALLLSLFVLLTSVILYIVPQGRVAYWADWRLWGLSKEQWGALHINTGLLFLIALILHIYYNWKPITLYLKNKAQKKVRVFTAEFNIALILVAACLIGTHKEIPPFSTVLAINGDFQAAGAQKYGEPPYGHAELSSLKTFTRQMGIDLEAAQAALKEAGITVIDASQSLKDIAANNNLAPQQVYLTIRPLAAEDVIGASANGQMPASPPPGLGNLTLAEVIQRFNLNPESVAQALAAENFEFTEEMTLKAIAAKNGVGPIDVYVILRTAQ